MMLLLFSSPLFFRMIAGASTIIPHPLFQNYLRSNHPTTSSVHPLPLRQNSCNQPHPILPPLPTSSVLQSASSSTTNHLQHDHTNINFPKPSLGPTIHSHLHHVPVLPTTYMAVANIEAIHRSLSNTSLSSTHPLPPLHPPDHSYKNPPSEIPPSILLLV